MKKLMCCLKVTMALLLTSAVLLSAQPISAQAEETKYKTANLDIVNGEQIRMPRTSTGAVVDGHQLHHDYVKILNVNNGNISIGDESYTQGSVTEPWTTQEDAYAIKGKGTSSNNITITPTKNEITIYLVDLEWYGQIIINGNPTNVNIVVCGNVKSYNTSSFINVSRTNGNLVVSSLNGKEDLVTAKTFLYNYFPDSYYSYAFARTVTLNNITINTNNFISKIATDYSYDVSLTFNNVELSYTGNLNCVAFTKVNVNNSIINQLDIKTPDISVQNSVVQFRNPVAGVINSTNSTLFLNSGSPSTFSKINLINTSLFAAVNFVGTPVDNDTNDLYVKKIRLRQYPNTFVWVSIDNGAEARLRTDSNGYLYPYVKNGTTRIDARLETGETFYATFPGTNGADNTTTNLLQAAQSIPSIISISPSKQVNVGETLAINITALPGTAGRSLSYQWYKNDVLLPGETYSSLTRIEAVTNDSGNYKCVVKEDGGGTVTSEIIKITVSRPETAFKPVIASQTSDMDLIAGSSVTLIVYAVPSVPTNALSYQWFQNNVPISSEGNKLVLSNINASQAGSYQCVVTEENLNTTAASVPVTISVR